MDPILMQKFQAIKKSKKSKKGQLLDKFFLYTIIAITCLFCSSPFWLPYLFSSMKDFLFIYLPKTSSVIHNPKLLFIVGNLIVAVLIGESKFFGSPSSFSGDGYYDEYVDRSRSLRERKKKPFEENMKSACMASVTGKLVEEIREVKKEKKDLKGENELVILPTEELKKRADDFIARVNRQRRLEAKLLLD